MNAWSGPIADINLTTLVCPVKEEKKGGSMRCKRKEMMCMSTQSERERDGYDIISVL